MSIKLPAVVLFIAMVLMAAGAVLSRTSDTSISQTLALHAARLNLTSTEIESMIAGEVIAHDIPTSHAKEMAGFGAMLTSADPKSFIEAFRTLSVFKQSKNVIACGLFGDNFSVKDLDGLTIKDRELLAILRARSKASDIKLSEEDIARIRAVAGPNPVFSNKLLVKLTEEYKQILVEKVRSYALYGGKALITYADQAESVSSNDAFTRMLQYQLSTASRTKQSAGFLTALSEYPVVRDTSMESFFYWAVQKFGQLKPVVSLVHVVIFQVDGRVFIASKQIYSSHYTEAGLAIAELVPFKDQHDKTHTLMAYTIRLQVDILSGPMGFMKKRMAQPRMIKTLKESLQGLRANVETADREAPLLRSGS